MSEPPTEEPTRSVIRTVDDRLVLRFHRARLLVEEGPDHGKEFPLPDRAVVIGRAKDADLRLDDATVSRSHVRVAPEGGAWRVEDLGSRSGTLLNGAKITSEPLRDGDRISLGSSALVFEVRQESRGADLEDCDGFYGMVAESFEMRRLFGMVRKVASLELPVLLRGETGTGKEGLAKALHQASPRGRGPYVVVDCTLLESGHVRSELFGHTKGAFTGADSSRIGAFVQAHGGTLFFDEIGELPLEVQPALLRALELGEVRPLGATETSSAKVRVVCATHRDLPAMVRAGTFRQDLLYRISAIVLDLPPLRGRAGDIDVLTKHLLPPGVTVTPDAQAALNAHSWPGNVRELKTTLDLAAGLGEGEIRRTDLRLAVPGVPVSSAAVSAPPEVTVEAGASQAPLSDHQDQATRTGIERALEQTKGHRGQAAELLGVSPSTLYRKMRKLGMKTAKD